MTLTPLSPLVQMGRILSQGLAMGSSAPEMAGQLTPHMQDHQILAGIHPEHQATLVSLVSGVVPDDPERVILTTKALLASDLATLSPDESAARLREISEVGTRLSASGLWQSPPPESLHEDGEADVAETLRWKADYLAKMMAEHDGDWTNLFWKRLKAQGTEEALGIIDLHIPGEINLMDLGDEVVAGSSIPGISTQQVLTAITTNSVTIPENAGQYPGFRAETIRLVPFSVNEKLFVYLNWRLVIAMPPMMKKAVLQVMGHSEYYEELLEAELFRSSDGTVHIVLKRCDEDLSKFLPQDVLIDPELRVPPHQFGSLIWRLTPRDESNIGIDLTWERKEFTYDLQNILAAYLQVIQDNSA